MLAGTSTPKPQPMQEACSILLQGDVYAELIGNDGEVVSGEKQPLLTYLYKNYRTEDNTGLSEIKRILQQPEVYFKDHILDRKICAVLDMLSAFFSAVDDAYNNTAEDDVRSIEFPCQ